MQIYIQGQNVETHPISERLEYKDTSYSYKPNVVVSFSSTPVYSRPVFVKGRLRASVLWLSGGNQSAQVEAVEKHPDGNGLEPRTFWL